MRTPQTASRVFAVAGVADSVIIVTDVPADFRWSEEQQLWTRLLNDMERQINRTNELIKIAGHPDQVMKTMVDPVPGLMAPVDQAIGLQNRADALKTANDQYALNAAAVKIYDESNKVLPEFDAFGEKIKRDPARYHRFVLQEAMGARYKKAVENKEAVDKAEVKTQRQLLEKLKAARTEIEVAGLHALIDSSKQREDMAHQKAEQAKGELDAFNAQLLVEAARKAEADREWAQTVVERMRAKALAAYQAQVSDSPAVE